MRKDNSFTKSLSVLHFYYKCTHTHTYRRLKVSVRPRVPRSRSNSRERFQKPPSGSHERSGGNPSTRYRSASRDSSRASSRRSSVSSNHSDIVVISGGGKRKSVSSVRRPKLAWGSPQLVPKSTTPISTQAKTPGTHNSELWFAIIMYMNKEKSKS